ncbi:MAG: class I tRNA ligase family protein, partial [Acetobacteraceae bacterium]|nr:class I tRNA ligase family protein [Acetobacteraceae bacterium]
AEGESAAAREVRGAAAHVLGTLLRLLHPAIPFVTEELWDRFGYGESYSLIRAPWPAPVGVAEAEAARAELDWVVRLIGEVRTVRAEVNVPPSTLAPVLLRDAAPESMARAARWIEAIRRLARAEAVSALSGAMPKGSAQAVLDEATLVIPLSGLIDVDAERARLGKERVKAAQEADKLANKLANTDFVRRAPEEVVEETRARQESAAAEVARLDAALTRLGNADPSPQGKGGDTI